MSTQELIDRFKEDRCSNRTRLLLIQESMKAGLSWIELAGEPKENIRKFLNHPYIKKKDAK